MKEINKKNIARVAKNVALALGVIGVVAGGSAVFTGCPGPTDSKPVDLGNVNGIPVSKEAGVSDTDAKIGADNARAGYAAMTPGMVKDKIVPAKVSKIEITTSLSECVPDGSGRFIIRLAHSLSDSNMKDAFDAFGGSIITYIHIRDGNAIRLASQFDTSKETVRLAFSKVNGQRMI